MVDRLGRARVLRRALEAIRHSFVLISENQVEASKINAYYARRLLEKARARKPYEYRLLFCRRCKAYSPIGLSRTIRLRRKRIIYTCRVCGGVYRRPLR